MAFRSRIALPLLVACHALSSEPIAFAQTSAETSGPLPVPALNAPVDPDSTPRLAGPLFSPEAPGEFASRFGLGVQLEILPLRLVESETRSIPQLTANYKLGLKRDFWVDARLSVIYIKNQGDIGAGWSYHTPWCDLGVTEHFGIRFGFMRGSGFDASTWSFAHHPAVMVGVPWKKMRFTWTEEFNFGFNEHIALGDLRIVNMVGQAYEGMTSSLTIENPTRGGQMFFVGVSLLYAAPYEEAWVAFSDEGFKTLYPRIFGGYEF